MPRGSFRRPPDVGRHRAVRPKGLGHAFARALVAAVGPALVLGLIAWITLKTASGRLVEASVDPTALLWIVVLIGGLWALWVSVIWRSFAQVRPRNAPAGSQLLAGFGVLLLCGAVTAPMAVGAGYAVVQRDLIKDVFDGESTATLPLATAENPWGGRGRVNVLLLGGDGEIGRAGIRTDSVMLASINTTTGKTVLFSLPRNLQRPPFKDGTALDELYPNGFSGPSADAEYFLNAVYRNVPALHPGILGRSSNEGADATKLAVSGALGIDVDYYVLVNLSGFSRLVDAIGGITVNINEPIPIGGDADRGIAPKAYLQPGPNQRLDGHDALWYTRGRYGSTDYKRMERQRCAISAITREADPATMLTRYTSLAKASKDIVRTDIPQHLLSAFVKLAAKVKENPIKSVGFERSAKFDPNEPDYAYMQAAVETALNPKKVVKVTPQGDPKSTPRSPTQASNTTEACKYRPVSATSDDGS